MPQFGAGSQLAAQCPIAPVPDGWRAWTDAEGPVPDTLLQRAKAVVADLSLPLGTTESYPLPGITTLIRIEPRLWARDEQGDLVQGCWRASGIYLPSGAPEGAGVTPPSTSSGWDRAITVLTVASLAVGTAATLATWGSR